MTWMLICSLLIKVTVSNGNLNFCSDMQYVVNFTVFGLLDVMKGVL